MTADPTEIWSALRDAVYNHDFSAAAEAVLECLPDPIISEYILFSFSRDDILASIFDSNLDLPTTAYSLAEELWGHPTLWDTPCEGHWIERCGSDADYYWRNASAVSDIGDLYFCPNWLSGSDYSGGVLVRSNFNVFIDAFGELDGVEIRYGGYASYWVCIRVDLVMTHTGIREMLESLESYPILDDSAYSEAQIEAQDEAWDSWVRYEFISQLQRTLDIEIDDDTSKDTEENTFDDRLYACFEEGREAANEYWEDDNEGVYLRIEEVVKKVSLSELEEHRIPYEKLYDEEPEEEPPFVDPNQLLLPFAAAPTNLTAPPSAPHNQ